MATGSHESRPIRRGLVLAGGGAKGAYAFGCLVALKRLGFEFDAISGTSVGALNAALWSTNSFSKGFQLWRALSFETIFPVKLRQFGAPRYLTWLLSSLFVSSQLIKAACTRKRHSATRFAARLVAAAYSLFCYALFVGLSVFILTDVVIHWIIAIPVAILYGVVLYSALEDQQEEANYLFGIAPIMIVFGVLWVEIGNPIIEDTGSSLIGIAAVVIIFTVLATLTTILIRLVNWSLRPLGQMTIFSSEPLKRHIRNIVTGDWKCPTIATTAQLFDVVDVTEDIEWVPAINDPHIHQDPMNIVDPSFCRKAVRPQTKRIWVPFYEVISEKSVEEAAEILLASAALPFGLAPAVTVDGLVFVDGGVVDNIPWAPLMDHELDEVFVILLETYSDEASALAAINMTRQALMESDPLGYRYRPQLGPIYPAQKEDYERMLYRFGDSYAEKVELLEKEQFPTVVAIYPEATLGGFVNGTLNFNSAYAHDLIRRGMIETSRRFAPLEEATSS